MTLRKINYRFLFWSFIALFLGISFARDIFAGNLVYIGASIIGIIFLLYFSFKNTLKLLSLILVFCLGVGVYFIEYNSFLGKKYEEVYTISGRVCEINYDSVVLENCVIENHNIKLLVYTKENLKLGDIIIFSSKIENIDLYEKGYFNSSLYRAGVSHSVTLDTYEIVENSKSFVEKFRQVVKDKLYSTMTSENAEICFASLFGDKSGIDYQIYSSFKNSGIAHLLAVSGLHIGFFSACIFFLLKLLRNRYIKFGILSAVLLFYCFLCSFTPSVVRASLMCLIIFSAEMFGRNYDPLSSIGFSGIIILLCSPLFALDLGFRLSYFCVLSIFVLYKSFYKMLRKIKLPKFLSGSLAVSLSTQLGILPFSINVFGEISIFSIITNLLAIPLFQVAYTLLMLGLVLSFIMPFMAFILKFVELLIFAITVIANFVSSIPFSVIAVSSIGTFLTLAYFSILFICSRFVRISSYNKFRVCSIILFSSLLLTLVI